MQFKIRRAPTQAPHHIAFVPYSPENDTLNVAVLVSNQPENDGTSPTPARPAKYMLFLLFAKQLEVEPAEDGIYSFEKRSSDIMKITDAVGLQPDEFCIFPATAEQYQEWRNLAEKDLRFNALIDTQLNPPKPHTKSADFYSA